MIDLIKQRLPLLLPSKPATQSIQPVSESRHHAVWKVTFQDRTSVAVKYHLFAVLARDKPFDLLMVEQKTSKLLRGENCSVPTVLATDPDHGLIITEWCGDHTLDDICQMGDFDSVADGVIDTLIAVESACHKHHSELAPHVAPGCHQREVRNTWQNSVTSLSEALPQLYTHLTQKPAPAHLLTDWRALADQIAHMPLALGPTDYNARNIVISKTHQPAILELAKIGYDWPERRMLQYTTSLGANCSHGNFIGLLTPKRAQTYANHAAKVYRTSPQTILTRLDAHHLAFHLFALQRGLASKSPYENAATRLEQIAVQLMQSFSKNANLHAFRTLFA